MEKFAFLFPGQGAQYIKMGEFFYDSNLLARETYKEASNVMGFSVDKLCFNGKYSEINDFMNMQVAIVTTEMAILRTYKQDVGIEPQFFIGHSIGEYAALTAAGAIEFKDTIRILKKRGELIQRIIDQKIGYMTIVERVSEGTILEQISKMGLEDQVFISCKNTKEQFAISGTTEGMEIIEKVLVECNAIISPLIFSPPMHSPLMKSIKEEFYDFLKTIHYFPFRIPIISNVTGKAFSDSERIPELMAEQLVKPVLFSESLKLLYDFGVTNCVEIGPKRLLVEFVNKEYERSTVYCYGVKAHRDEIRNIIDSDEHFSFDLPNFIGNCLALLASTENRNSDNEEFKEVQLLYKKLKKLYQSQEVVDDAFCEKILREVIEALYIKKLDNVEIKACIKMLLDNTNTYYKYNDIYEGIR